MIEFRDVSFSYPDGAGVRKILSHVSLSLNRGKVYALTGPSGSGKTTVLNLADGQLSPSQGQILYDNRLVTAKDWKRLRGHQITRVFQDYRLIPFLSARENVELAEMLATGRSSRRSISLLEKFGLKGRIEAPVSELSGGERQRTAIARALTSHPQVILADEPTGALDEDTSLMVGRTLVDVAHEFQACVVFATHDLALAKMADQQLVLTNGAIRPIGNSSIEGSDLS